jgi:hypothetical protein
MKRSKTTWQQLQRKTGINIAILKATPATPKVEKVRGIQI